MNVRNKRASISRTIRYIWTRFSVKIKHQTTNITEHAKCTYLQNPRWQRTIILNFKKMLKSLAWLEIFAPNLVGSCIRAMRKWSHEIWNRKKEFYGKKEEKNWKKERKKEKWKLIYVTSSDERRDQKYIILISGSRRDIGQIWCRIKAPHRAPSCQKVLNLLTIKI